MPFADAFVTNQLMHRRWVDPIQIPSHLSERCRSKSICVLTRGHGRGSYRRASGGPRVFLKACGARISRSQLRGARRICILFIATSMKSSLRNSFSSKHTASYLRAAAHTRVQHALYVWRLREKRCTKSFGDPSRQKPLTML